MIFSNDVYKFFSLIEFKLTFLKMQIERSFVNTTELCQSRFRNSPEFLTAVHIMRILSKFVLPVFISVISLRTKSTRQSQVSNLSQYTTDSSRVFSLTTDKRSATEQVLTTWVINFATPHDQAENDYFPHAPRPQIPRTRRAP
jgi:hypothetical protein